MTFENYASPHRERLIALANSSDWKERIQEPGLMDKLKRESIRPPSAPSQMTGASRYLTERNEPTLRRKMADGDANPDSLLDSLSDWSEVLASDERFPIYFLGLILTLECSFSPRCIYCNQAFLPRRMTLDDWKAVISEAADPVPPYLYLTGGEPLILGEEAWGANGLIAHATRLGCAVNLNTNAALIDPWVALQLVRSGLSKVHISLDSADPQTQGDLFGDPNRFEPVMNGIYHLQIARELLGSDSPQIHINCVMTRKNLFQIPDLIRALMEMRPLPPINAEGWRTPEGILGDFAFHLIPVGGKDNEALRPSAEEWHRFYTETWEEAERVWDRYAASLGAPKEERETLQGHVPFANPYQRAEHRMSLEEYCEEAAQGVYWQGALMDRCYLASSQAYVLPDGTQHWCGAHAIRRVEPLGNVKERSLRENIRLRREILDELPVSDCVGCAGATCVINQSMDGYFKRQIEEWLHE